MPGPRQPLAVLEGNGRKHLTEKEKAERAAGEVKIAAPKQIRPPDYLPENLKQEFKALGKKLKEAGLLTELDFDGLARYLLARQSYLAATQKANVMLKAGNAEGAKAWGIEQERYFKQARNCANDMGLTVTSRCRIVVPPAAKHAQENPLERMMRERQRRA